MQRGVSGKVLNILATEFVLEKEVTRGAICVMINVQGILIKTKASFEISGCCFEI